MGARQSNVIFADIWSEVEAYVSPRELVSHREVCKIVHDSAEEKLRTVAFLKQLLEETCRSPPTGKLIDAFLPGVRMLGPHSPNEAPAALKCKLDVALGFECMSMDMLGFTVCGMGTASEFCNTYLPVVWKLCVHGETGFTTSDRHSFLLTARAIRTATSRLESGTKKITVVRMGKGAEARFDMVHQALILCVNDSSDTDKCSGPCVPTGTPLPTKTAPTPTPAATPPQPSYQQDYSSSAVQTPVQHIAPAPTGHPVSMPFVVVPATFPQYVTPVQYGQQPMLLVQQMPQVQQVQQVPVTPPQHSLHVQQQQQHSQPMMHTHIPSPQAFTLDPGAPPLPQTQYFANPATHIIQQKPINLHDQMHMFAQVCNASPNVASPYTMSL